MGRFQLTAGRSLRLAVFLLVILALGALWVRKEKSEPPESDTDSRIAFYSARAAGRGTYPAYARLGAAYLQKARETGDAKFYALAETNLKKSQEFQINFEAIRSLSALSLDLHRFTDALRYAQQAVDTMSGDLESRGLLFDAHLAIGNSIHAEATLRYLQANAANDFGTITRQANLQESRGDLAGALASIERACADAQPAKLSRQSQAWCQVRLGSLRLLANCDAAGAETAYRRALQLLPDYFLASEHLAELLASAEKHAEAAQIYEEIVRRAPNPKYNLALAELHDISGNISAGIAQRRQALVYMRDLQKQGDRRFLIDLARLLIEESTAVEDRDSTAYLTEGLQLAEQEVALRRDIFALEALANAQFRNGQKQAAVATIEGALKTGTKNPSLLLQAAVIFKLTGQPDRARKLFDELLRCPSSLSPSQRGVATRLASRQDMVPD